VTRHAVKRRGFFREVGSVLVYAVSIVMAWVGMTVFLTWGIRFSMWYWEVSR
jgi:hypothetical protein